MTLADLSGMTAATAPGVAFSASRAAHLRPSKFEAAERLFAGSQHSRLPGGRLRF